MESDRWGGTLNLTDPVLMAHIEKHTDLVAKFTGDVRGQPKAFDSDEFYDFAVDEIGNEAVCIKEFERKVDYYDGEETFSHMVMEYQGIYFYQSIEYDPIGFWLDKSVACDYAAGAANP